MEPQIPMKHAKLTFMRENRFKPMLKEGCQGRNENTLRLICTEHVFYFDNYVVKFILIISPAFLF